jgi:hypothetical protein
MGNGLLTCKCCSEFCCGRTQIEINNNLYGTYPQLDIEKSKSKQIITNIYIPNCKVEISNDSQNNNIKAYNRPQISTKNLTKKNRSKTEKNIMSEIKDSKEIQNNNFTQFLNEVTNINNNCNNNNKNANSNGPSPMSKNHSSLNYKAILNNYCNDMLNYINKIRNNPNSFIDDIDEIIKNDLKTFDDKEYIVSESTNEMIKLGINLEKLKENIIAQENVEALNLNVNLKMKNFGKTEINDSIINELVISKKREIYKSFPKCFFYPIFIKDIKINFIHLLANNKLKEKIFYPDFSNFYVTVFNEKNNRFFAILCLA